MDDGGPDWDRSRCRTRSEGWVAHSNRRQGLWNFGFTGLGDHPIRTAATQSLENRRATEGFYAKWCIMKMIRDTVDHLRGGEPIVDSSTPALAQVPDDSVGSC
jgi:hypothetical protein